MAVRSKEARFRVSATARAALVATAVATCLLTLSGATGAEPKRSVREQIGAERAVDLLESSSVESRLRGIALLNAQLNGPSGVDEAPSSPTAATDPRMMRAATKRRNHAKRKLVAALGATGQSKTAKERLAIVRALADWAEEAEVMQALTEFGLHARSVRQPEVAFQVRGTTALALARSGDADAYKQLGVMLTAGDTTGDLIAEALTTYPPEDPDSVLAGSRRPTVPFLNTLATHDSPATRKFLRDAIKNPRAPLRAKAALVLDAFGDPETKGLAEFWLKQKSNPPVLQLAAFEILCRHDARAAAEHLPRLLNRPVTARAAVEISRRCGAGALTKPLVPVLEWDEDPNWVTEVMRALGAIGDERATTTLVERFSSGETGALAAHALAENERGAASTSASVVTAALANEKTRRNAARAVLGSWIQRGAPPEGVPPELRSALEKLSASSADDDKALGAWGLAFIDEERGRQLLASKESVIVASAARGWVDAGRDGSALAQRAVSETDLETRRAFAVSLIDIDSAQSVPTSVLVEWVEGDPLLAPLAARALAARDDAHARSAVASLLNAASVHARAHVADGLGYARNPDAIARLNTLYLDGERAVRLAAVRALARRRDPARRGVLTSAARYDIDTRVRDTARQALGQPLTPKAAVAAPPGQTPRGRSGSRRFFSHVARIEDSFDPHRGPVLVADDTGLLRPMQPAQDGFLAFVGEDACDNDASTKLEVVVPEPSPRASNESDESDESDGATAPELENSDQEP